MSHSVRGGGHGRLRIACWLPDWCPPCYVVGEKGSCEAEAAFSSGLASCGWREWYGCPHRLLPPLCLAPFLPNGTAFRCLILCVGGRGVRCCICFWV